MQKSKTRIECENAVLEFVSDIIANDDLDDKKVLYVGIAGDPTTKGEYSHFFPEHFTVESLDADAKWNPDIVCDITKPTEDLKEKYDVVVMVQVIEHIPNLWEVPAGIAYVLKNGGFAIVDCPFMYPYHPEPPSFGDYWRITKDGFNVLFSKMFEINRIIDGGNNTSCLMTKK